MKTDDQEQRDSRREIIRQLASEIQIPETAVAAVLQLLADGATIPFLARYRKEKTGGLDEIVLSRIAERNKELEELQARKRYVLKTIEEAGQLTPTLKRSIELCQDASELEDLFLPYKPKRKTRASAAREIGLEPLAKWLYRQEPGPLESQAVRFLNGDVEAALQGARDIIAEWISEHLETRTSLRKLFLRAANISCKVAKGKETEGKKYADYFQHSERLSKAPSHRLLAIFRAESEGIIRVHIAPEEADAMAILHRCHIHRHHPSTAQVKLAMEDSYKRLLQPAMETEMRQHFKALADAIAIRIFQENLSPLLLAPPLGQKRVMGIDPGFRTGCKVVCLSDTGALMEHTTIYPHTQAASEAEKTLLHLAEKHQTEAIAIGNGTAGKETLDFVRSLPLPGSVDVFLVSESGASIYSASPVAREEFPDLDLTYRSAISIGRRLMDPLAELIKTDPRSIGVGQYQHDVHQGKLKEALDQTVMSCVNKVGINVNTASVPLLTYVSGLGPVLAANIVRYRSENGPFPTRDSLKKVPRLGDKAFEQCAGFLRIRDGKHPLDNTGVHPERYALVQRMAEDLGVPMPSLPGKTELISRIRPEDYVSEQAGLPTLKDILRELSHPGLDPRGKASVFHFNEGLHSMEDLREGMLVRGIVTNITQFGAFVDIGVKQDGMVHISQISDRFIKNPAEVLSLGQEVHATVIGLDMDRRRIQLSLKGNSRDQR
jgi:protein Tex